MITSFITTNSFSQKTIGSIDRIEKEINSLIDKNTKIEVLADGFVGLRGRFGQMNLMDFYLVMYHKIKYIFGMKKMGLLSLYLPVDILVFRLHLVEKLEVMV